MKNKYQIVYIPRIENEIVIAQYNRKEEAKEHMNYIKVKNPIVLEHHYIKEVKIDEQN